LVTASAPGKIILFGEHAVVYGRPALAIPVTQVQATAEVSASGRGGVWIEAPDIGLAGALSDLEAGHPLAAAVRGVLSTLQVTAAPDCTIHIHSTIPVASGLGSGAAVSVATLRALSAFLGHPLPNEQVNNMAFEIEKLHHGTPSGIDNTVITYSRPVFFVKDQPIETLHVAAPFTIVVGDTGIPAPTIESVSDVRRLWEADQTKWEGVFDQIGNITYRARQAIESGFIANLGGLMVENQSWLELLTVSSAELEKLISASYASGANGAKLSGGGRGGNMIALVEPERTEHVAAALKRAGAVRTIVTRVE
jgi:mevalonate kinase